jgi:hypothetical protein
MMNKSFTIKNIKFFSTILLLMLFMAESFAFQHNTLVVEMRDGSTANFLLSDKPRITFTGEHIRVLSDDCSMEFVRSNVKKYHFSEEVSSDVAEILTESQVTIENEMLVLCGVAENTPISVYTTNGILVKQTMAVGGNATISLSGLASGFYIVTFNNTTFKFLK